MIGFLRSFFGLNGSSGKRMVVGHLHSLDVRDVEYVKQSTDRLHSLQLLVKRYQGTPHEAKIRQVYEKSKSIHTYLVDHNRVYELELFHLRNTDHFISTFNAIINVHQQVPKGKAPAGIPPQPASKTNSFAAFFNSTGSKKKKNEPATDLVKPLRQQEKMDLSRIPSLQVPEIALHTFEKIPYLQEGSEIREIGFTSTPAEKQVFLQYVAARLELENLSYVGNAALQIPNQSGTPSTGLVPVVHWAGYMYALNLNDFRLFPVKIGRNVQY